MKKLLRFKRLLTSLWRKGCIKMIKKFNEVPQHRDGGAIYWSYFEKIKMMHDIDPALAGELAISMFE